MTARLRLLAKEHPNATLLVGSCLIAGMLISFWVIESWEYLPEWAPVPGPALMNTVACLRPFFLFACGLLTATAFLTGLVVNRASLGNRALSKNLASAAVSVAILAVSTLPIVYKGQLDKRLQQYAISRYDVVIDAIEKYHADNGYYPSSLEVLVPAYLPGLPGKYMKFGEELNYYPDASSAVKGYVGHGPFIFELTGMYAGIHGQTLKYCPVQDETCSVFKSRIDDRWVWAYSSIL
jgi:hypothetical protein